MQHCPLCASPAGAFPDDTPKKRRLMEDEVLSINSTVNAEGDFLLQRVLWQVTSILLLSGIISTIIVDLSIHKTITWSIYPLTVCLIIFSYVSLFAFWYVRMIYQIIGGLLISSVLFIILDSVLPQSHWLLHVGLPLLCAVNLVSIILIAWINRSKHRGLNVIAYTCVAIAMLCVSIEFILSFYSGNIVFQWSAIVAACMLPVTAALLFMHYRIKKNPDIEKIFHT